MFLFRGAGVTHLGLGHLGAEVVLIPVRAVEDALGNAPEHLLDGRPVDPGPIALDGVRVVGGTSAIQGGRREGWL